MTAFIRWIDRITSWSGLIVAWLIFPLILATIYEVASRYLFDAPTMWAFEMGYMAMGVHALMGAAYTLRCHGHIRIDVLYIRFSEKRKALIDVVGYVLLFLPVISWVSFGLWEYWVEALVGDMRSGQSAWNPLIWPFRLTFFAGMFLLWLQGISEVLKAWMFLTGRSDHYEAGGGIQQDAGFPADDLEHGDPPSRPDDGGAR